MPVADGSASAPPPRKTRGGGGTPTPAPSAPALASPPRNYGGGGGGSSSPSTATAPSSYSYDYPESPAPKPLDQSRAELMATAFGRDMTSSQPKAIPPKQDLFAVLTNPELQPQPKYQPGAVAEAESHLAIAKGAKDGVPLPLVNAYGMRTSDPAEAHQSYDGTVADAREELADAERGRRRRAVRANAQGEGVGDVERMTQEEYDALTDKERAAIDFNTMLVGATRRDRRQQDSYDPNQKQEGRYDRLVKEMFGEDGGSQKFAPETVALLDQIGFKDQAADLDDFLGLKAAITEKDINNMGRLPGPTLAQASMNEVQLDRLELTAGLAVKTDQMESALVEGNRMLATVGQTAGAARGEHVDMLGGDARDAQLSLGFGTPQFAGDGSPDNLDTYFQVMYDKLADAKGTRRGEFQTGIDALHTDLSPQELSSFMEYADTRSSNADRYGIDLGDSSRVKYRSPEDFRKLLGLDGGKVPQASEPKPRPEPQPQAQPQAQPQLQAPALPSRGY